MSKASESGGSGGKSTATTKATTKAAVKAAIKIKDSGKRRHFTTGSQRDVATGKGRMDLLPMRALLAVSKHFEAGAGKYQERNWEKGQPIHVLLNSGMRHVAEYLIGMRDEPHLEAACWNLLCALDTVLRIREGVLPAELWDVPGECRAGYECLLLESAENVVH
jgi:hypothetical protein